MNHLDIYQYYKLPLLLSKNYLSKYKVYALTNDDSLVIIDDIIIEYKGSNPKRWFRKEIREKVITSNNKLNYKYNDDYKMIDNK